ncbi:MAG: NAD(P)/FAD-dependent oxidoreductase [Pseudomonadota bacterium]|nr:NAD(P)/FAD-dependent oxidoreductase [Pseudomonadota bacterium]
MNPSRIVIVGGGAGGLELATRLGRKLGRNRKAEVVLVDANPTHVWKPLLHEVASGSLDSSHHEVNYRVQARANHFRFQLGRLCGLDRSRKALRLAAITNQDGRELVPEREIEYEHLVLAIGSTSNDFGTEGAAEHCIFLDAREAAERFHRQLVNLYLEHEYQCSQGELQPLEIAIVGGGATGVELAAELYRSAAAVRDYGLDPRAPDALRVTLVEASERILGALPERLAEDATKDLRALGVRILTSTRVTRITAEHLETDTGEQITATLKVWCAGVKAPEVTQQLDGLSLNRAGQIRVRPSLQSETDPAIFAIGDCAETPQVGEPRPVPPRAQAAHQAAKHLSAQLPEWVLNQRPVPPFVYRDRGSLVTIGAQDTLGNLMGNLTGKNLRVAGYIARFLYQMLYLSHQAALHGPIRAVLLNLGGGLRRLTRPGMKLH